VNGTANISSGNNAELRQTLGDFEAMATWLNITPIK